MEVDIGEVERHRPALGDLLGFVETASRGFEIAGDGVVVEGGGEEGECEELNSPRLS